MKRLVSKILILAVLTAFSVLTFSCDDDNDTSEFKLDKIILNKSEISMYVGDEFKLTTSVKPEHEDIQFMYNSSKPEVATIDAKGKIVAKSLGVVIISATEEKTNMSANCLVSVIPDPILPNKIKITNTPLKLKLDETKQIEYTIMPEDATNKSVSYVSGSPEIATVDENGNVTAKKLGNTLITVTSKANANVVALCGVIVDNPDEPVEGAVVPKAMIGDWKVDHTIIEMYGWGSTEEQILVDYPSMEDTFNFYRKQFFFCFKNNDFIELKYRKLVHQELGEQVTYTGKLTLKDIEKGQYVATFEGTENEDIKTIDLNFKDGDFWFVLKSASSKDDTNLTKLYMKKI